MSDIDPTTATDSQLEASGMAFEPPQTIWRRLLNSPVIVTFTALIAIIAAFSLKASGQFDTTANFRQLAQNVAILTVVSVGTTFVIATAGVDLSIPSGIVLGEVFAVKFLHLIPVGSGTAVDIDGTQTHIWYILFALCGSLLAGLALGLVNGIAVGYMRIPALLATLGTLGAGLGIALLLQNGVNTATYALDPVSGGHAIPSVPNLITIAALAVILSAVLPQQERVRAPHARDREQRGGGAARGHQGRAPPAQGVRPWRRDERTRRLPLGVLFHDDVGVGAFDGQPARHHCGGDRRDEPVWRRWPPSSAR